MNKVCNFSNIDAEVSSLIESGVRILNRALSLPRAMEGIELAEFSTFVTRLGQLIRKLYGENSQHFSNYSTTLETKGFYVLHSNYNAHAAVLVGIAKTIKHDIDSNLLGNLRSIISADIFSDFLEMGEYLLNEGYKDAAAVIIGSVLEDGLRKLAERHGIETTNQSGKQLTIDPLNVAISNSGVYSKLTQKQITTWAHVRNKAAHGEYAEYNTEQVQMMLIFVQSFVMDHLES